MLANDDPYARRIGQHFWIEHLPFQFFKPRQFFVEHLSHGKTYLEPRSATRLE
jgi:hypothetical protein